MDSFNVTITQLARRGEWVLRSHIIEDTMADAEARIARSAEFYRSRGYGIAYRVTHQNAEVLSGQAN
jgi:hypothetical protein